MKCRYCKCGNEMLVIKKEFSWYWCGRCGRFLNGSQILDPGDDWLEPLSSHAVLGEVIAEIKKESSAGNEDFIRMRVKTLEKLLGKYFA